MILSLIMLVLGLFLICYNEKFCLYFLVFIMPFIRATQSMVLVLLVILLAMKIIVKLFTSEKAIYKRSFMDMPMALLFIVWITTTITSVTIKGSMVDLVISTLGLLLCFISIQILDDKKDYVNIITSALLSNFVISLYGIYQFFIEKPINDAWVDKNVNPDLQIRAYSVLGNPNILSQYLLLILPIGIMFLIYKKKITHKILLAVITGAIFLCLLLTLSRASLIGVIVSFLTIGILKYSSLLIILVPLGVIALMFLAPSIFERLLTSFNTKDTSISSRVTLWNDVMQMIKDYMFTGVGFGVTAFSGIYLFYKHQYLTALHAHNFYLEVLAETGIIGFIVFMYFLFIFIVNLMKNYIIQKEKFNKYITLGTLAAFLGILMNGMAEYTWADFRVVTMFWIVVGIGASLTSTRRFTVRGEKE